MVTESLVKIRNLTFYRGNRLIYDNVDFDIQRGKIIAVMGPSGTGKTTLLRLIGGQLRPHQGQIEINGRNVPALKQTELYEVRRNIGMLFQNSGLFTNLTVFENVAFPLREHTHLSEAMIRDLVLMKLQAVGLRGARDLMPSELSGGMARRVALARAIALDPQLIMYDEPLTGQDPIAKGVILQLIKRLNDALGLTSILVSHDVAEALSIADYAYIVSDGKIIGKGTPEEIRHNAASAVQQFIQGLPDGIVPFHYPAKDYAEDLL
ncbi:MAG: ATP-binding cassette protein [Gammaproteobacteria bacterium]|jgi:phospholipid/cholesterol/gamma-HCH transport system ATP-binding protein|nr:ATP-binding cassette protein [Gammaproteobacteria bacterium]